VFIIVKFQFDPNRCVLPYDPSELRPTKCLKCLDVCPNSLIMFRPLVEKDEREKGEDPKFFEIYMVFKAYGAKYCPECLKCVEICPEQAITIKF